MTNRPKCLCKELHQAPRKIQIEERPTYKETLLTFGEMLKGKKMVKECQTKHSRVSCQKYSRGLDRTNNSIKFNIAKDNNQSYLKV